MPPVFQRRYYVEAVKKWSFHFLRVLYAARNALTQLKHSTTGDSVFLRGDLQSQWRQLPSMAGRHFDPHQYHASITDRLFAPSKLGSSTHVEISRESHANAPLSDFNGYPSSLAGQRRKIRPDAFKGKKHDQKFCFPDFWHGGDWGHTDFRRIKWPR